MGAFGVPFVKTSCSKNILTDSLTAPVIDGEPLILYQVQQVVEKSLKAVLIFEEKAVPLTHSLELLISELVESDQKKFPEAIDEPIKNALFLKGSLRSRVLFSL
ncbi:MAG: hypothetical protein A2622_07930 [Bdellovibrionales bacterium RIFCSPHIGHO2_01_FULL_40_29]|nr:MAG: hypothetical protein A2622_07930 [Bdellovibrionales bacterium RIFCSPHIGHO2_01_FULL_40_29]